MEENKIGLAYWFSLLQWFSENRRNYSFRQKRDPYHVWISEVALQQTRISAAESTLEKFFIRFPDNESLARAPLSDVLAQWSGLGYYNRARQIHLAANLIIENYNGQIPQDIEELKKIPSIGPYTAGAIASLAFQQAIPAIDGNGERLLSRLMAWPLRKGSSELRQKAHNLVSSWMLEAKLEAMQETIKKEQRDAEVYNKSKAMQGNMFGNINEAIMELGQTVCMRNAVCEQCPWTELCLANKLKNQLAYPLSKEKKKKELLQWHLFFIQKDGEWLLNKWTQSPLLTNHWGVPAIILDENKVSDDKDNSLGNFRQWLFEAENKKKFFAHAITHHKICVIIHSLHWKDLTKKEKSLFLSKNKDSNHLLKKEDFPKNLLKEQGWIVLVNTDDQKWVTDKQLKREFIASLLTKAYNWLEKSNTFAKVK